jgi:bifunctional non-homologous end joining protein LigD
MSLTKYEEKRDFTKTDEPKSGKSAGKQLRFVIQRHHASRLHYDFRLELDGTLKSWAVPKGPSLNPKDKRLAMMVEDHPIDYQYYEGIIPNGNYGAGVVIIWDKGTYTSLADNRDDDVKALREGLKTGNLKFRLDGDILKGEFALVKIKNQEEEDNAWLLIKHNDEYAVAGSYNSEDLVRDEVKKMLNNKEGKSKNLPNEHRVLAPAGKTKTVKAKAEDKEPEEESKPLKEYKPMLATLADKLVENEDWIYERKLDGYRAIGYTGKNARLISRNGIDFSDNYSKVRDELEAIEQQAVFDGELVIEDKNGKSRFQDLQNYGNDKSNATLKYYVFDLLSLNGHDLRGLELIKRKQLLEQVINPLNSKSIMYNEHVKGGKKLFKQAGEEGWEGIIGKAEGSYYNSGKRTDSWLKFKLQKSQEAIICGYTEPTGSRKHFGALILGMHDAGKLKYIGNCGTGFNEKGLKELFDKMHPLETKDRPFPEKVHQRSPVTWLKPKLVCEVVYSEWTEDGHLRHPVYKGLRIDKNTENVIMETPGKQMPDEVVEKFGSKTLKLTHLNKIYWPQEQITKGQLINYYRDMADYILPYLKDKPQSLRRQPNGIGDEGFFQKDTHADGLPAWIKTVPLHSDSNNKEIKYMICNDAATLLYMANLGCIEINPWLSKYQKPENPEFVVIDLDPQDVPFEQVIQTALKTKEVFDRMKLDVFVKTSGSRGMHIYCYLGAKYDYDFTKMFAEYTAQLIHHELPDITSLERSPAKRRNLIYLDFLQNRRGQTIACPYSARPKPGATVSTPLYWHEVKDGLKMNDFTIFNILERVKSIDDPWKNLKEKSADLKSALEILKQTTDL